MIRTLRVQYSQLEKVLNDLVNQGHILLFITCPQQSTTSRNLTEDSEYTEYTIIYEDCKDV